MQKPVGEIGYEAHNPFHHLMVIHLSNLLKNMPLDQSARFLENNYCNSQLCTLFMDLPKQTVYVC